jgi:cob(I)alamin adenosyltransferase
MRNDPLRAQIVGKVLLKSDPIFEALGDLDELMATLALVRVKSDSIRLKKQINQIEADLQLIAAIIAGYAKAIGAIALLDRINIEIEKYGKGDTGKFVQPENEEVAWLNLTRTVARRSERRVVGLDRADFRSVIEYLNKLSTLLFQMMQA